MNRHLLKLLLVALFFAAPVLAQTDGSGDAVLRAMRLELARSKAQLKLPDAPAPYFISYEVTDYDTVTASAEMGAMHSETRGRARLARVIVRVGDYKQDSYYQRGLGVTTPIPLESDEQAIRTALWLATDEAYKMATEALTAKQARLKQLNVEEKGIDDFAHVEPVHYIGPLAKVDYDSARWRSALKAASAVGKKDPDLQEAILSLEFHAINRYLINSEGTETREGQTIYSVTVDGTTQASDGMDLRRDVPMRTTNAKELPSQADLVALASKVYVTLKELRNAPVVDEEFRGPTLFSADASASVFSNLVGENVLGVRPNLGESARVRGAFASNFKSRVLPDFLDVFDDPTVATVHGQSLLGNYAVDQEGVKAERVSLIEKGILLNYTLSRTPIRDFARSNGHGRARVGSSPGASLGNLFIRSNQPMSPEELKKKFLERCKDRGLPYGYHAVTLSNTVPRLLYRVYVNDGHEELVRGASFGDLDTRSLRSDLIAAADDTFVDNRILNIPHSIVAPSMLFEELEIRRANRQKDKLPEYPPPAMGK